VPAFARWYAKNLLLALDQLGTAVLGGFCDETLSSYANRMRLQRKPWGFTAGAIDWVALHVFRDPDHCRRATLRVRAWLDVPPELR
jgi:hypothetical protein